jgi:hypothetical protein
VVEPPDGFRIAAELVQELGSESRSSALRYREEGSFERAFSTIASRVRGTGEILEIGFGSPFRMEKMTAGTLSPLNGGWPVSISYITTPQDQMSVLGSTGSPRTCSGDM